VTAAGNGEVKTVLDLCFYNRICHKMQRDLLRLCLSGVRAAVCVLFLTVKIHLSYHLCLIRTRYASLCLHNRLDALKKQCFSNARSPAELFHKTCTHACAHEKRLNLSS